MSRGDRPLLAFAAARRGVLGAWEALAAVERCAARRRARPRARAARAGRPGGRGADARRSGGGWRCWPPAALAAAGWLAGGAVLGVARRRRRAAGRRGRRPRAAAPLRARAAPRAPAPAARALADALGGGHSVRGALGRRRARRSRGAAGNELRAAGRALASASRTDVALEALRRRAADRRPGTRSSPPILLQRDAGGDLAGLLATWRRRSRRPSGSSATRAPRPPRRASPPASCSASRSAAAVARRAGQPRLRRGPARPPALGLARRDGRGAPGSLAIVAVSPSGAARRRDGATVLAAAAGGGRGARRSSTSRCGARPRRGGAAGSVRRAAARAASAAASARRAPRDLAVAARGGRHRRSAPADVMAVKAGAALAAGRRRPCAALPAAPGRLGLALLAARAAPSASSRPDVWLRRRTAGARRRWRRELADVLDLLRVAVAAGLLAGARARRGRPPAPRAARPPSCGERRPARARRPARQARSTRLERALSAAGVPALVAALHRADRHGAPLGPPRWPRRRATRARAARAARPRGGSARRAQDPARRRAAARPGGAAARGGGAAARAGPGAGATAQSSPAGGTAADSAGRPVHRRALQRRSCAGDLDGARSSPSPPRIAANAPIRVAQAESHSSLCGTNDDNGVAEWDDSGVHRTSRSRSGVAGLLPLRHPGSTDLQPSFGPHAALAFHGTFEHSLDAKNRLTVPAKFRAALAGGVFLVQGHGPLHRALSRGDLHGAHPGALRGLNPFSPQARELKRMLYGNATDAELDSAGPRDAAGAKLLEHAGISSREVVVIGAGECLELWDRSAWEDYDRDLSQRRLTSPRPLAILLDMPRTHVPVLAGELIEALDPQPGQVAVDCTLGAAGHARLVAGRLGPGGTLIGIDRDPLAEQAFAELAAEVPCRTRFVRADFAARPRAACATRATAADLVYLDLGMSSMQVDTRERGFSYAYDAPLDMRMDPEPAADRGRARQHLGPAPARPRAARVRRGALRRPDRRRDRPPPGARPLTTTFELVDAITAAIPAPARFARRPPGQAHVPGDPHRRQRRARRSSTPRCRSPGTCCAPAAAWPRSPSTRSRTGASSASSRAARAAASARPTCRSAAAVARPRPSWSSAAQSCPLPARSPTTRVRSRRACAPPASSGRSRRCRPRPPAPATPPVHAAGAASGAPPRPAGLRPAAARVPRGAARRASAAARPASSSASVRCPTIASSTACCAGACGSGSWACCWAGSSPCRSRMLKLNTGISRAVDDAWARSSARTRSSKPTSRGCPPATGSRDAALAEGMVAPPAGVDRSS